MGIISRMEQASRPERRSLENPAVSLSQAIDAMDWGARTTAGTKINEASALNLSAVWAAVRVISNAVASLPLNVYERLEPRGREKATEHPLFGMLHDRPNPEMSSFVFREMLQAHLLTWGNAYAEKERNGRGEVVHLWPITPNRVTPRWVDGPTGVRKVFDVNVGGVTKRFTIDQIMHIPGFGYDGLVGYSPISLARESLGLAKAAEEFGAGMFGRGLRQSGVLSYPSALPEKARANLMRSLESENAGLSNSHRMMLLEEGLTYTPNSIPPDDAQFLETRQFQVVEIARWMGCPPHKIGDLSRATFSNIEHQSIEFATDTVRPWLVRWEQVFNWELFSKADRGTYYAEFAMDGLLRGDTAARGSFYAQLFNIGALSDNDIRESENMNPIEGGDRYYVQGALVPIDKIDAMIDAKNAPAPAPATQADEPKDEPADESIGRFRPVLRDAADRLLTRELSQLRSAIKNGNVDSWAEGFYYQELAGYAASRFLPACLAIDAKNGARLAGKLGSDWAAGSLAEVRRVVKDGGDLEVLAKWWEAERAEEFVRAIMDRKEAA